jgi:hypothetical protein
MAQWHVSSPSWPATTSHKSRSRENLSRPIDEKTIADFTRVIEQTGILKPAQPGPAPGPTSDAPD